MTTCILIPSYEKYRVLAGFTASQIDHHWREHPPIFFCGLSVPAHETHTLLMFERASDDWLGILIDAVRELRKRGFRMVYVILDDHPPLGPCRYDILNNVLPEVMLSRGAEIISLFGSGQGRNIEGDVVLEAGIGFEQLPDSYLWRYSLHPALWSLQALEILLSKLDVEITTRDGRTPWAFERLSGVRISKGETKNMTRCYRLTSNGSTASQKDQLIALLYRVCGQGSRSIAGMVGGSAAWNRMSCRFDFIHHYFGGPYPMIWQGIMAKGTLNPQFVKFCQYFLKANVSNTVSALLFDDVPSVKKS